MHLGAIIHENTYYVARFVSLRDPQKISVLVSYWFVLFVLAAAQHETTTQAQF